MWAKRLLGRDTRMVAAKEDGVSQIFRSYVGGGVDTALRDSHKVAQ